MKGKLSATVEDSLLEFLDSLPGSTRSEKLERVLEKFKRVEEERQLRQQLKNYQEDDEERVERDVWERTMDDAMWRE